MKVVEFGSRESGGAGMFACVQLCLSLREEN